MPLISWVPSEGRGYGSLLMTFNSDRFACFCPSRTGSLLLVAAASLASLRAEASLGLRNEEEQAVLNSGSRGGSTGVGSGGGPCRALQLLHSDSSEHGSPGFGHRSWGRRAGSLGIDVSVFVYSFSPPTPGGGVGWWWWWCVCVRRTQAGKAGRKGVKEGGGS